MFILFLSIQTFVLSSTLSRASLLQGEETNTISSKFEHEIYIEFYHYRYNSTNYTNFGWALPKYVKTIRLGCSKFDRNLRRISVKGHQKDRYKMVKTMNLQHTSSKD